MIYRARRQELLRRVGEQYADHQGFIVIAAGCEEERNRFWQDSTFLYLTGIHEPGAVLVIASDGVMTLYIPTYEGDRSLWMGASIDYRASAHELGFDEVLPLGAPLKKYQPSKWLTPVTHQQVITKLRNGTLFVCCPSESERYPVQRTFIDHLTYWSADTITCLDISSCIADMRRSKSAHELQSLCAAIAITQRAHAAVARAIEDGISEAELAALIDYTFVRHGARAAFPSIVAGGARATILHYHDNNQVVYTGELVIVDIGASVHGYAADISRTLPVSGVLSPRQKDLYDLVGHVQNTVFSQAKPGMFLCHQQYPELSLHHIAVNMFREEGLDRYFLHSIGHFLGLDVHDVGNVAEPLRPGDVITIEPGLYIREEGIGIRIEDDYLITEQGAVCLSGGPVEFQDCVTKNQKIM